MRDFRRQHREAWLKDDGECLSFEVAHHPSLKALKAAADSRCGFTLIWHHLSIVDHPSNLESTLDAQVYLKFDTDFSFTDLVLVSSVGAPERDELHWSSSEFLNPDWFMSFRSGLKNIPMLRSGSELEGDSAAFESSFKLKFIWLDLSPKHHGICKGSRYSAELPLPKRFLDVGPFNGF
ncbi:hypothetical protein AOQ84DRAFT_374540 [Glonium stellatum]|uniref:Uncharacterized protein n=1 Tax=Glonium stellatum TaxID=574774 RepID=A0A8E2F5B4_9PEZI|nr:hypothetical protein AOQ84DRAFT_374540 [Glonium stellatum]